MCGGDYSPLLPEHSHMEAVTNVALIVSMRVFSDVNLVYLATLEIILYSVSSLMTNIVIRVKYNK